MGKWLKKLQALEGAVPVERTNPHMNLAHTASPSVDFTFGNSWGLPLGYTLVMYGPPKAGKSVIANSMIGQLHRDYPDAIAIKFNTEMREGAQGQDKDLKMFGIDPARYVAYDVNAPEMIFDRIEKDIAAACEDGEQIKLIIIDSVNGVLGRRGQNADTVLTQQIGDHALTIKDGLRRILMTQRKYGIAIILTTHVAAEMDQLEQKRGNKVKMSAAFGLQHHSEYFAFVDPNLNKDGRSDLLGKEYVDETRLDMDGRPEKTAHKIRFIMKNSSMGPKGRYGEFTFSYEKGIINQHEEVFLLGVNRGVIEKPNNVKFVFKDKAWVGKEACLEALAASPMLCAEIVKELKSRDTQGAYAIQDAQDAKSTLEESA